METISDLDETVGLDESEWVPSDNYSDDDSIEIVGELTQTVRPVSCFTRAAKKLVSPSKAKAVVMVDSDNENELPNINGVQATGRKNHGAQGNCAPVSKSEIYGTKNAVQKNVAPASKKSSTPLRVAHTSLARYAMHGPPLGVELSSQTQENQKPQRQRATKRKQFGDRSPSVVSSPQKNAKRRKVTELGNTDGFVRLSTDVPTSKASAKKKKKSSSDLRNDARGIKRPRINKSSAKSISNSHLNSHVCPPKLKREEMPSSLQLSGVKKEIDGDVARVSSVVELDAVKEEVNDIQVPAYPAVQKIKATTSQKPVKLESSTMSLDCSTSSEFTPVKKPVAQKPTLASQKASSAQLDVASDWDVADVISMRQGIDRTQAKEIIKLVDQECTLPFIARYRRENTGNLDVNKLREVLHSYEQLKEVKEKVSKLINGKTSLEPETRDSLLKATSLQEVKCLTASLKSTGTKTYADRARKMGLGAVAEALLKDPRVGSTKGWAYNLVDPATEGRRTVEEVETNIKFILADLINKKPKLIERMRNWLEKQPVLLKSSKSRKATSQMAAQKQKKVMAKRKNLGGKRVTRGKSSTTELTAAIIGKYENYFDFTMNVWRIQPHAVCAINRGEQQGVLTVKVVLPTRAYDEFKACVSDLWLGPPHTNGPGSQGSYRYGLIQHTLHDCWERLVSPNLQSWVRSKLSETAELASVEVFVTNLRHLLLTPPVRANTVLAIDPGFHKGCKIAVVERKGKMLAVETIYPFVESREPIAAEILSRLVCEYRCEVIAIGNGTACRETEAWLSRLIKNNAFPGVNVQYTIINESGASQYSVTDEARAEFPNLDVNHISAVSLARRLQDPLLEYVKVPPMHLGVGMYQHDVSNKLLTTALNSVVMECVSFVGVDLNVASEVVLRKVSGLNKARAAAIVKYRDEVGPFRDREQLKKVKGIGPVSFQQCAGFVKVVPQTLRQRSKNSTLAPLCPLDSTTVHPESYSYAKTLIKIASLNMDHIGSSQFIGDLKRFVSYQAKEELSKKCGCSEHTLNTILESLYQPLDFDYRAQFDSPLFRKGVTSISELRVGQCLTGSVQNVTTFGAFVDIGIGNDGLIHKSRMLGRDVHVGNTVEVRVWNLDVVHNRVGLQLLSVVR